MADTRSSAASGASWQDELALLRLADDGCPNQPLHHDRSRELMLVGVGYELQWIVDLLPGGALNIRPERRAA